jgi:prevent-host-death family protein
MQVNMLEAKNQLSKLVQAAEAGQDVIIARNGVPVVRLLPFNKPTGLQGWGSLKGMGKLDAAFDEETEAEVARLMMGKR